MPIDYTKYPKNWKSEIVPFVLERDEHKCKFCGLENKDEVISIKINVSLGGAPKIRTLWFRDQSDFARALHLCGGDGKKVKVVLTVAHLDHDEANHDVKMDRLAALCQYCHLNYDAKEKSKRSRK